jgi:hypothetical protein
MLWGTEMNAELLIGLMKLVPVIQPPPVIS